MRGPESVSALSRPRDLRTGDRASPKPTPGRIADQDDLRGRHTSTLASDGLAAQLPTNSYYISSSAGLASRRAPVPRGMLTDPVKRAEERCLSERAERSFRLRLASRGSIPHEIGCLPSRAFPPR